MSHRGHVFCKFYLECYEGPSVLALDLPDPILEQRSNYHDRLGALRVLRGSIYEVVCGVCLENVSFKDELPSPRELAGREVLLMYYKCVLRGDPSLHLRHLNALVPSMEFAYLEKARGYF